MDKRLREQWVPAAAAAAVAVAALSAVIMARRGDDTSAMPPMVAQAPPASTTGPGVSVSNRARVAQAAGPGASAASSAAAAGEAPPSPAGQAAPVVKAPPLKPPPKPPVTAFARNGAAVAQPGSGPMGGSAACGNCGTVETVVAVLDDGKPSGYQMHIRMDDGSQRMVEQRGALAAGSRVRVEGKLVKALSPDG